MQSISTSNRYSGSNVRVTHAEIQIGDVIYLMYRDEKSIYLMYRDELVLQIQGSMVIEEQEGLRKTSLYFSVSMISVMKQPCLNWSIVVFLGQMVHCGLGLNHFHVHEG